MSNKRIPIINPPRLINRKQPKSRRGNILVRPSTWDAVQKILKITEGGSFNDLVCTLLDDFADDNAQYVYQYDKLYSNNSREITKEMTKS